jgi:hypothetical protein
MPRTLKQAIDNAIEHSNAFDVVPDWAPWNVPSSVATLSFTQYDDNGEAYPIEHVTLN